MSYLRTPLGMIAPMTPKLVPLFPPELIEEHKVVAETLEDRSMASQRGIATPAPLTAAQLPSALAFKPWTLGKGESPLKTVAIVGVLGIAGYFIWRKTR